MVKHIGDIKKKKYYDSRKKKTHCKNHIISYCEYPYWVFNNMVGKWINQGWNSIWGSGIDLQTHPILSTRKNLVQMDKIWVKK